jgi:chromosome segregation ATPase
MDHQERTMAEQSSSTSALKEKLQQHIEDAKQRMEQVKQDIANLREQDKESIRKKTAEIQQRIQAQQQRAEQLRDQITTWMRDKKQQTDEQVMTWRKKRELKHLERRADRAEEYAINVVVSAMMDADEAEVAVLDALDARLDADTAASAA